jgi:hypothetical protein
MGRAASARSGIGRAGAGLRIAVHPAASTAATTASSGTSKPSSSTPSPVRRGTCPAPIDDDQRHAGGRVVAPLDAGDVDPLVLELAHGGVAELVRADRADHRDVRAQAGGGHRLVGPLAAAVAGEAAAGHGLTRPGKPLGDDHEVGVDRPDDDDPRHGAKPMPR